MILRRFVAFILFMIVSAFQAEAGMGMLRDLEEHHADLVGAVALDAAGGPHVQHGSQIPDHPPGHQHPHGDQHSHGSSGDHCNHQHLAGLTPPLALSLSGALAFQAVRSGRDHFDRIPRTLFHPPRA